MDIRTTITNIKNANKNAESVGILENELCRIEESLRVTKRNSIIKLLVGVIGTASVGFVTTGIWKRRCYDLETRLNNIEITLDKMIINEGAVDQND